MPRLSRLPAPWKSQMPEDAWYFTKHVFACAEGDHVILLDLKGDEYFCVPRERIDAEGALSKGWLAKSLAEASPEIRIEYETLLSDLQAQGLVTANPDERNPALVVCAERASSSIGVARDNRGHALDWLYVPRFLLAVSTASRCLGSMPLESVVAKVARRRAARPEMNGATDLIRCTRLVATFNHLRPFVPRKAVCLFDSLALLEFLARCGQFPNWVFGVQTGPFSAHCWVQAGHTVLNDSVEQVSTYTAIMVV